MPSCLAIRECDNDIADLLIFCARLSQNDCLSDESRSESLLRAFLILLGVNPYVELSLVKCTKLPAKVTRKNEFQNHEEKGRIQAAIMVWCLGFEP